ncbi:VanZ family protein [Priestia flexa]|nr:MULTISPECIES: VanZ family protein [Bacillaceae]MCM3068366.1 VanZ family protein [Priestia flexa]MCP1188164.1 VanZ family protein [Priestia flexa]SCC02328.1 VanZ like family protein [Priestia flexa]
MTQLLRAFGGFIPFFLLVSFIVLTVFIAIKLLRNKKSNKKFSFRELVVDCGIIISLIAVFFVTNFSTLLPGIVVFDRQYNFVPFIDIYIMLKNSVSLDLVFRNILLNICLFVPFGFLITFKIQNKLLKVTLLGFLLSFLMEFLQYVVPRGRIADINDIITNSLGVIIGYLLAKLYQKISAL